MDCQIKYININCEREFVMEQPVFLTRDAFDSLLANLLEIEEGIPSILDGFCSGSSTEAREIKQILNDYLARLNDIIPSISTVETGDNLFPYVIVGCEVTVEDAESRKTHRYRLISPLESRIDIQQISFLSPLGKALLLKKIGERFTIETPGGNFTYKVLSIRLTAGSKPARFNFQWVKGGV